MSRPTLKLIALVTIVLSQNCQAIILRNNALMDKMVSHFQEQNPNSPEERPRKSEINQRHDKLMSVMQNVLCKNFPSIPCRTIVEDKTLKMLIEKSIQQINYKKLSLEKTTAMPGYHLTLFPIINSEELSNYLRIRDAGYYEKGKTDSIKKRKQKKAANKLWQESHTKYTNNNMETKRSAVYGGVKKLRKFYPHKIKYKDKSEKNPKNFGVSSEEKLSMSVEVPDMTLAKHHQQTSYKLKPANPPLWMIDYMKHGEPNLNGMNFDSDTLKGKLMKSGPNVIVDENVLERGARKEVLHPDVYIKTNFVRKNEDLENSEALKMSRPVLTSHVLDTSVGKPAAGLFVDLFKKKSNDWTLWHSTATNADGRIQFPFSKDSMDPGTYKLHYKVGNYYKSAGKDTLYPYAEVVFDTKEDEHYHIALLLTPYGYSTYRGS